MEPRSRAERSVAQVLADLPAELQRTWSTSDLSERSGVSESHFRRACLALTGEAPKRLIKRLRLENARRLICTTNLSIKEIANAVGISDLSHFVRDFRAAYGVSPSQARYSCRRKLESDTP